MVVMYDHIRTSFVIIIYGHWERTESCEAGGCRGRTLTQRPWPEPHMVQGAVALWVKDKSALARVPSHVLVRRAPSGTLLFIVGRQGRIAPVMVLFDVLVWRTLLSPLRFE